MCRCCQASRFKPVRHHADKAYLHLSRSASLRLSVQTLPNPSKLYRSWLQASMRPKAPVWTLVRCVSPQVPVLQAQADQNCMQGALC